MADQDETLTHAQMAERKGISEGELAAQVADTQNRRILLTPDTEDAQKWQAYCEECADRVVKGVSMKSVRSEAARHNQAIHLGRLRVEGVGGLV